MSHPADPSALPDRYLIELLTSLLQVIARQTARLDREATEDKETLHKILYELKRIADVLEPPPPPAPSIQSFTINQTF